MKKCENCDYCQYPRTSNDNWGACKCKAMKRKTIDVSVAGGQVPEWCPLNQKETLRKIETKMVLISVQPNWVKKIVDRIKRVEIRKAKPQQKPPFKCLIYCTKEPITKKHILWGNEYRKPSKEVLCRIPKKYSKDKDEFCFIELPINNELYKENIFNGKVIGEFICDYIEESIPDYNPKLEKFFYNDFEEMGASCLSSNELTAYGKGKPLYGWHISNLKIYDKPKELSEFYAIKKCNSCKQSGYESSACIYDEKCEIPTPIKKAPQSWCYVEEV